MPEYNPDMAFAVTEKLNTALDWLESLNKVDQLNVQAILDNDTLYNSVVASQSADQEYVEKIIILKVGQMAAKSLGDKLHGINTNTLPRSEEG